MKNFSKIAVITAALALIAQGAKAANADEDLVLGFSDTTVGQDYTIDLGSLAAVTAQGDLSSDISSSTYTSTFTSGTVTAGVAGGGSLSSEIAYMTVTSSAAGLHSSNPNVTSGNHMTGTTAKGIGNGANSAVIGTDSETDSSGTSWFQEVVNYSSVNANHFTPQTTVGGSTIYEDLYSTPNNKGGTPDNTWAYLGYFTLNMANPNSPTLTFTSANVAVPEPATYGFLAGAGLLVVALRRQFTQKAV